MADPLVVHIEEDDDSVRVDPTTGTVETDQPDGGVVVQLHDHPPAEEGKEDEWFANLAANGKISATELGRIANDLFEAVTEDDKSREGYLNVRKRGLDLLGLKLEEPKATVDDAASSSDGMSSVTNPLLLEAVLKGWANARAELLPAEGPVKIDNEGDETEAEDALADALERDMNEYLTNGAPEYYPDTSHMLLWGTYFGGSGFKKVYRCPMRRRPVSESVDAKNLIVSDTTKDLRSCGRVTHEIPMRQSVMKRMKLLGVYRDVALTQPSPTPNQVDQKIAGIQGTQLQNSRPEDQPYTLWETQCELDLDDFAPKGFKGEGIPLPYLVTLDKDSREILALRRDWEEDDEEAQRQQMYVKYPYVPGPGFYGTGMLNILGNASAALTAAWRETLDAGMFASFPGGLMLKLGQRQNTQNFRVSPGEFAGVESNGQMRIQDMFMGMPYKDVTPGLMTMIDKVTEQAKGLGGAAEVPVSEGVQNVPVGSMLAAVEQATKVMAAAHKDMCVAMADEIKLIINLFRRHPEDFWRGNKKAASFWDAQKLTQALNDYNLIPRADPNTPSHIHRLMKAMALLTLSTNPIVGPYLIGKEIALRCLRAMREDPNGLVQDPPPGPQGPPVDPAKMLTAQAKMKDTDNKAAELQLKAQTGGADATLKAAALQSQEKVAGLNVEKERIIHAHDAMKDHVQSIRDEAQRARDHSLDVAKHGLDVAKTQHDMRMAEGGAVLEQQQHGLDVAKAHHEAQSADVASDRDHDLEQRRHGLEADKAEHAADMAEKAHQVSAYEATKPEPKPAKPKGKK